MAAVLAAALAAAALPFYKVLFFSDRALLFRDLSRDFLPAKTIWANSVAAGNGIPYWNHFVFGGMPYYANSLHAPLHPLNALFLLFAPADYPNALSLFLWAHYVLLFLGAYFLGRTLRLTAFAALAFAALFALSGFAFSMHTLPHILCSAVALPIFFALWIRWLRAPSALKFFGASGALAWPVYGGDPQISYFLAIAALLLLAAARPSAPLRGLAKRLGAFAALGFLSLLAASAQFLPTLGFALDSERGFGRMPLSEILYFSFHPARLLETLYPLFFGNRIGLEGYSGESLVNFPNPTPFIFSTYPGALAIFLLLTSLPRQARFLRRRNLRKLLPLAALGCGFLLAFGAFSWIPLYEWCARFVPLFSISRYPERLLLWPLFALWILALGEFRRILRANRFQRLGEAVRPVPFAILAPPFAFALISGFAWAAAATGLFGTLPPYATRALGVTTIAILLYLALFAAFLARRIGAAVFSAALALAVAGELGFVGIRLVWDQSKFIADGRRYALVRELQEDLESRKAALVKGGARRLAATEYAPFAMLANRIDHASLTSFATFDTLLPNAAAYFGFEDSIGYCSLEPRGKRRLWAALVRGEGENRDARRLHDLIGAYYVPERDPDQRPVLRRNEDALPYVFVAARIVSVVDSEAALAKIASPEFRLVRDATFSRTSADSAPNPELTSASAATAAGSEAHPPIDVTILKRDGKAFELELTPAKTLAAGQLLIWNESFDGNWQAYVNGSRLPTGIANAWALGALLPELPAGRSARIVFRFEDPRIPAGWIASSLWLLVFAAAFVRAGKREQSRTSGRFASSGS